MRYSTAALEVVVVEKTGELSELNALTFGNSSPS